MEPDDEGCTFPKQDCTDQHASLLNKIQGTNPPVMGPEPHVSIATRFSDKVHRRFDGHADYASYR